MATKVIKEIGLESSMSKESDFESNYLVYFYNGNTKDSSGKDESLSLNLLGSSLSVAEECDVRPTIAGKVAAAGLYHGTGHICSVSDDDSSFGLFLCLLKVPYGKQTEEQGTTDPMDTKDILIVLMHTGTISLELFRPEMEVFCKKIIPHLNALLATGYALENFSDSRVAGLLSKWYYYSVLYLDRCISFCGKHIAQLLFMCILTDLEVTGNNKEIIQDVKFFLDACSLASLVECSGSSKDGPVGCFGRAGEGSLVIEGKYKDKAVGVKIASKMARVSSKHPQPFCTEWASIISSKEDPISKRQSIENYKLKIIQDVNFLKRLLQQAEMDYYSLYKAFLFLCRSGNGEILLHIASLEATTSGQTSSALAVVEAVSTFSFKNSFQHVRQRMSGESK